MLAEEEQSICLPEQISLSPRLRLARVCEDEAEDDVETWTRPLGSGLPVSGKMKQSPTAAGRKLACARLRFAGNLRRSTWQRRSPTAAGRRGSGAVWPGCGCPTAAGQRGRSTWPRMSDGGGAVAGIRQAICGGGTAGVVPSLVGSSEIEPLLFFWLGLCVLDGVWLLFF
jgi:hypothetical protein